MDNRIEASTQYNDLRGTCAIDEHPEKGWRQFAATHGVDVEKYFPISFGVYKEGNFESVDIDAVEKDKVASNYKELQNYLEEHGPPIPVVRFHLNATLSDCFDFMKRFTFVVTFNEDLEGAEISIQE